MAFQAMPVRVDGMEGWELSGPGETRCLVLAEIGSQLGALRLAPGGGRQSVDVLYVPPPAQQRQATWSTGAPILFPFPGRIAEGEYRYRGRAFRLPGGTQGAPGRHPLHGFVGLARWSVDAAGAGAEGAWVRTAIEHESLGVPPEAFPGRYRLTVTHQLRPDGYVQEIVVDNTGTEPFPFGYGWHPYFLVPLAPGGLRADCALTLRAAARWELTAELLPTGRRLAVAGPYDLRNPNPLGEKSYDDPFTMVERDAGGDISATLTDGHAGLCLTVWADSAFRDWVVYAPRTLGAVSLEPYTCAPDAFNLEARGVSAGLLELSPGQTWRARLGVRLGPVAA